MPDKGWQRRFDEPIPLSKGKKYAFVPAPSTMPSRWQGETKVNIGEVEQAARIVAIGAGIIFGALAIRLRELGVVPAADLRIRWVSAFGHRNCPDRTVNL